MYQEICKRLEKDGCVKTAVVLEGEFAGVRCFCSGRNCLLAGEENKSSFDWKEYENAIAAVNQTEILETDGQKILVEVYTKNPQLVLLGGGHVSRPVAKIASMLGFLVTVMDDREEFVQKERFPEASRRIVGSFDELSAKIPAYSNSYYVVVTRGHAGDTVCARQILKRPYRYLGMIGSRTKVRLTRETLLAEGFAEAALDSIHAPVGLPIGGETPEEIAVSIMAEIIKVKNEGRETYLDEKVCAAVAEGKHGVMMTIVKKEGSSPRGVGSKMFLDEDGNLYGSIGGGSAEFEALKYARTVTKTCLQTYVLSPADTRNLGMICGGNISVFFECI